MFFIRTILVPVIFFASVACVPDCRPNKWQCTDGRCVDASDECVQTSDSLNVLPPSTTERYNNIDETCFLPQYPKNGKYGIVMQPESTDYYHGRSGELHFTCDPGYVLVGAPIVRCIDRAWEDEFPRCESVQNVCQLKKQSQLMYECQSKNAYVHCGDYVAVNTRVKVTRNNIDKSGASPLSVEVTCNGGEILNNNLKCVKEIEKLQNEFNSLSLHKSVENPNLVGSEYEEMAKNFDNFQHQVMIKLNQMHDKIAECDIYMNVFSSLPHKELSSQCNMPSDPQNGKYSVTTEKKWLPIMEVTVLHYECDAGFVLIGNPAPRCINGAWQDEFPECFAACKLEKKSKFNYQCLNPDGKDVCLDFVLVGSIVKVTRRQSSDVGPVTATISCQNDGTFNITTDCVTEIDQQQQNFEHPTMTQMTDYENKFNTMKSEEPSPVFEELVKDFHSFEKHVHEKLNRLHQRAEECDIYLDLLLPE